MKTTQRIVAGCMAAAVSFSAGFARAAVEDHLAAALLAGAAVGQQGSSGSIFSGFSNGQAPAPSDPFAARGVPAAAAPGTNGVTRLPPTGNDAPPSGDDRYVQPAGFTAPQTGTGSGQSFMAPLNNGNTNGTVVSGLQGGPLPPPGTRAHSDFMLRQARLCLAVQDVRRALRDGCRGPAGPIRYAANEDCPDRVEAAIAKFAEISRLDRGSEENRRTYARMWVEQAQDLMQWGEWEPAERLAMLAVEQRVTYGPFDAKPDELLRRIAAMREMNRPLGGPRPASRPLVPSGARPVAGNGDPNAIGPSQAATAASGHPHAKHPRRPGRRAAPPGGVDVPPTRCHAHL